MSVDWSTRLCGGQQITGVLCNWSLSMKQWNHVAVLQHATHGPWTRMSSRLYGFISFCAMLYRIVHYYVWNVTSASAERGRNWGDNWYFGGTSATSGTAFRKNSFWQDRGFTGNCEPVDAKVSDCVRVYTHIKTETMRAAVATAGNRTGCERKTADGGRLLSLKAK